MERTKTIKVTTRPNLKRFWLDFLWSDGIKNVNKAPRIGKKVKIERIGNWLSDDKEFILQLKLFGCDYSQTIWQDRLAGYL